MKKMLLLPMAAMLVLMLAACNTNNNDEKATEDKNVADEVTDNNVLDNNDAVNDTTAPENDLNAMDNNDTEVKNNPNGTTDMDLNNDRQVTISEKAATKIAGMKEVDSVNVLVTKNNAYVGVALKNNTNATPELEKKVADEVRASGENFDNVYVSFNPDFTKQMADYGTRIRNNEPVEGFFDEFSDAIERTFPNRT